MHLNDRPSKAVVQIMESNAHSPEYRTFERARY